ncbi:diguanylate cyclase [Marinobacterium sp. YM272]|uniref:GGDEF domain-containing protein n=1 Tax=Marinobacterium sp. YM272 TaxID=3421654 RepID=UPI003D7F6C4F
MTKIFVLVLTVFFIALIGIFSRPSGYLADLWPANSLLLGLMLREPRLVKSTFWLWSGGAMVAADLMTGSSVLKALVLNTGNIFSVMAGVIVARRWRLVPYPVRDIGDVLNIALVALAAAVAAGLFGIVANPLLFDGSVADGLAYWLVTEFVNYVVFLPLIIVAPGYTALKPGAIKGFLSGLGPLSPLPGLSVIALCLLAMSLSGPGVIAVPLIGLLWCAFAYSLFNTALVTLVYCVWTLISLSNGYIDPDYHTSYWMNVISLRVSVAMVALLPIIVSCYTHLNSTRLSDLEYASNHDHLTGTLTRRALNEFVRREAGQQASMSLLMADLDHFKAINDNHGHPVGDQVLRHFVAIARQCLRSDDLICRMGGEEFMLVFQDLPTAEANSIGNRIRSSFEQTPMALDNGETINATVSIGIAVKCGDDDFDALVSKADQALYRAKHSGRNRVINFADLSASA